MDVLDRLERVQGLWQGTSLTLNPPASPAQLAETERIIGAELPGEVRRAYLRFNGTTRHFTPGVPPGPTLFFLPRFDWVSLEKMAELWILMKETSALLIADGTWPDTNTDSQNVWGDAEYQRTLHSWCVGWVPKWIPIGDEGHHRKVYVDLHPAPAGVDGQLIYTHEDVLDTEVAAPSFNSYLDRFLTAVERGLIVPAKESAHWKSASQNALVRRLSDVGL